MPILFSSFPGWLKTGEVTVPAGGATSISFNNLNIAEKDTYMLTFKTYTDSAATPNFSLIFNDDDTATNYYTETVKPVVNIMTSATANNAIMIAFTGSDECQGYGYIFVTIGTGNIYIGEQNYNLGASISRQLVTVLRDVYDTPITKISIVSDEALGIGEGSVFTLFKKI